MPQISLYIDESTLKKIELLAQKERKSISKWVGIRIKSALQETWPENYFSLYGRISDNKFKRPSQPELGNNAGREKI